VNQDPIEEQGGINLYAFVGNDGVNGWDYLGNHAGHQPSELESEGWIIYPNGGLTGQLMYSDDGRVVTYATMYNRETGETRYRSGLIHQNSFFDSIHSIAFGVIASVVTFGAAAPALTTWAAGTLGVAATSTTAAVAGSALAGAAAGVASQIASTQSFDNLGQAALAGAIGGGVSGYYGNTWNVSRVATTTVASGVAAEVSGGDFRDGALIGGALAVSAAFYNRVVGYPADPSPGGEAVLKTPSTPPVRNANNIGYASDIPLNQRPGLSILNLTEGSPTSNALSQIPTFNAIGGLHDVFQNVLGTGIARNIFNVPGMPIAAAITWGALVGQSPGALIAINNLRNQGTSNRPKPATSAGVQIQNSPAPWP
jgi:hypothetical protein